MSLEGDSNLVDAGFDAAPEDPLRLLERWRADAERVGVREPNALVLSTAGTDAAVSSRVVLLKEVRGEAIVFASSAASAKGRELEANPWAAGTLWWRETIQQVNFAGPVAALSALESDALFQARPREAQAVAILSHQSEPLGGQLEEDRLVQRVAELAGSTEVLQRPRHWQGYGLRPHWIEFWHGRPNRVHRRLRYDRTDAGWIHGRLQP